MTSHNKYVSVDEDVVIEAGRSDDVIIAVRGLQSGFYDSNLKVSAQYDKNPAVNVGQVTLTGYVRTPKVLISSESLIIDHSDDKIIEMGKIAFGDKKSIILRIVNKSCFNAPLKLELKSEMNFFSISQTDQLTNEKKLNFTSHDQPQLIWLHFNQPITNQQNCIFQIKDQLQLKLDSESCEHLLDSINIQAMIGFIKIEVSTNQKLLETSRDSSTSINIFLKNSGNLPAHINLQESSNQIFSFPSDVIVPASGSSTVQINFKPSNDLPSDHMIDSTILATIKSSGISHQIDLKARIFDSRHSIISSVSSSRSTSSTSSVELLSNKPAVRFGHVVVGESKTQVVTLKSVESDARVCVSLRIKGADKKFFQIINDDETTTDYKQLWMSDVMMVKVRFEAGYENSIFNSKLVIHQHTVESKQAISYNIPLSAYTGCSDVVVTSRVVSSNHKPLPIFNQYLPKVHQFNFQGKVRDNLEISNRGSRAAYVIVQAYKDAELTTEVDDVICVPSKFVIGSQRDVTIAISRRRADDVTTSAWIVIWSGDELSRNYLRRAKSRRDHFRQMLPSSLPGNLRRFDFDVHFPGEASLSDELSAVDDDVINANRFDIRNFFNQLRQTLVHVTSSTSRRDLVPHPSQRPLVSRISSFDIQRESENSSESETSASWKLSADFFSLYPRQLLSGDFHHQKLFIKNFSNSTLNFQINFPENFITISPKSLQVPPCGDKSVLMSANPSLMMTSLPWSGNFFVWCSETMKCRVVRIQIKIPLDQIPVRDRVLPRLVPSCDVIDFGSVEVGRRGAGSVDVKNESDQKIKWLLTSCGAPQKTSGKSLVEVDYSVFAFASTTRCVEAGLVDRIYFSFNPRAVSKYEQYVEIQFNENSDFNKIQKLKIKLTGNGIENQSPQIKPETLKKFVNKPRKIYVRDLEHNFPETKISKSTIIKIPINNSDIKPHKVFITNLQLPFCVKKTSSTIKSKCSINLPVYFYPKRRGAYKSSLDIQCDDGSAIKVTLNGEAID